MQQQFGHSEPHFHLVGASVGRATAQANIQERGNPPGIYGEQTGIAALFSPQFFGFPFN
jgi:hypothetical protein